MFRVIQGRFRLVLDFVAGMCLMMAWYNALLNDFQFSSVVLDVGCPIKNIAA